MPSDIAIEIVQQSALTVPIQIIAGSPGPSGTLAVGTVTTGAAGSQASVVNVGTPSAAVFNFVIPRGADGASASVSIGSTTTGAAGTNASVTNSGTSSAAVFNFTIPRGVDGTPATVSIGTVTTGAAGSSASVTNVGTPSAAVLNFVIPRGDAGAPGSLAWADITGKPATFPPDAHGHVISDVTGLQTALDGKAASSHTHTASQISDSTAAGQSLLTAADVAAQRTALSINNVDNTSDASKPISTATQTALDGKANTSHVHIIADVTGLQTALDGKQAAGAYAAAAHTHGISDVTGLQSALDAKAPLASPTFTGTVSGITKSMVGLGNVDNTSDASKPISTATQTALDGKAATSHTHAIADVTGLQTALDGKQAAGSYAAATHTHAVSDVSGLQTALDGKQKTITSGTAAPSGGVDGDFYFQYT